MCRDKDYVQGFMMGNIVFEEDMVNLRYTTCVGYFQSVKKSIVFASKDPEDLDDIIDLFNSQEFRNYVGEFNKKKPIIEVQNLKVFLSLIPIFISGNAYKCETKRSNSEE